MLDDDLIDDYLLYEMATGEDERYFQDNNQKQYDANTQSNNNSTNSDDSDLEQDIGTAMGLGIFIVFIVFIVLMWVFIAWLVSVIFGFLF